MNVLVLMATFNGEKYIEEQLASVFNQKNVRVKMLIRDDGSTDQTVVILEKWACKHNLIWYIGEHLNAAYSFFELMERAVSYQDIDYFAFCDQDDVWDEDKLWVACCSLEQKNKKRPLLYYSGQTLVDENLKFISVHRLNTERTWFARFLLSDIAGCTAVFNRVLLQQVVCYKPSYIRMHDVWTLKVCLAIGGEVVVDETPHIRYRQHGNNAVGLKDGFWNKLVRVKKYIFESKVQKQLVELQEGYSQKIIPEYKQLIDWVLHYEKDALCRKELLDKKNVDFCNWGLNLTYHIKVILRKL